MDPDVPLVIPEVNPEAMADVRLGKGAIVANPNCSTIICLMAVTPLHRHAKVKRMVVSTYQAASGAGAAAMEELKLQTREVLEGKPPTCNIFSQQYAFNIFSHNAPIVENGYNEEEMKMVKETRKIWNDKDVRVTATCIRVPTMRAHAESVNLQFEKPLDEDTAREILRAAPGVTISDDRAANRFPTPLEVSDKDDVSVGRIRQDLSQDDNRGLELFVCGDQIRKGAALNAVQIAEMLLKGWLLYQQEENWKQSKLDPTSSSFRASRLPVLAMGTFTVIKLSKHIIFFLSFLCVKTNTSIRKSIAVQFAAGLGRRLGAHEEILVQGNLTI
ncbi:hypothetical protein CFC21_073636 [Triticum aestivum]|uniref:Semialdehyde dehydrogenase dimerisation domain-containing protein n=3 Tax=Triticum TaxID=4564 RepID=A0A9R0XIC4_TRITD|nr:hypothetical protein CFC21_073636 [Triticum aestivum]VAI37034.1 unnamed protein product [Triticum turgidum subsp. durum]